MSDERSVIAESVHAALSYAVIEWAGDQLANVPERVMRPDACGTLCLGEGICINACFGTGSFPTLASLEGKARRLKDAAHAFDAAPILIAPFLSEAKQQHLRDWGVGYVDAAGNAWISASGVLIDRSGKKPAMRRAISTSSLFSDKATLVIRLLFSGKVLGVREMSSVLASEGSPLSPGYISKTVAALAQSGYAVKEGKKVRLASRDLLLADWAEAYRSKARAAEIEGWYLPEADPVGLALAVGRALGDGGALTDRAGAYFVDPYALFDSVDVLVRNRSRVIDALRALGAEPADRGANINLRIPVYPVSSFYDMQVFDGVPVASNVQLYLDLVCQPQRGREAADHLFSTQIGPLLERKETR